MKCVNCLERIAFERVEPTCDTYKYMQKNRVCQTCAYWLIRKEAWWDDPYWFRIGRQSYKCDASAVYEVNGEKRREREPGAWGKGFGGRVFTIKAYDHPWQGSVLKVDNLWAQGPYPAWLGLEDNAMFVEG